MPDIDSPNLDSLYSLPSEMIQKSVLPHLVPFHVAYIEAATFFCLATGRQQGLDASPRGGEPGFVHVLDSKTLAFADWPGNNRIESLRNLQEDSRAALLFIFPGLDIFMRVNGNATVSSDPDLLVTLGESGKIPKTAIVILIDEVLFHCGKAINRARLWADESRLDRAALPSVGAMKASLTGAGEEQARLVDEHYSRSVRTDLY
jgi:PPOX class probable FMN-dependent enzyme